ncbi:MAG: hypothetical protein ABSB77_15075 [Xanthobacteraceae bacterium]|jgi:hypothetical protein
MAILDHVFTFFSFGTRGLFASRLAKLHFGLGFVADKPSATQCDLKAPLFTWRRIGHWLWRTFSLNLPITR